MGIREKHPAQYVVKNRCLYVTLLEDLDQHNVDRIRARLDALIDECHTNELVFDFGKVNFMDSSGIGMIMGRYRRMALQSGKVRAVGIHPAIARIMKYSGLYQILEPYVMCGNGDNQGNHREGGNYE